MDLLAVHLSDGVLTPTWWMGGWVLTILLVALGSWGLRDEDIPRVALMAAAFFVVTLIHVPVPGGPRAHLLLVGLLGVVLGRHAALAIPIGLTLQSILFSHGGLTMIGVNSVVMTVPALLSWGLFAALRQLPGERGSLSRSALIFGSVMVFLLSAVFAAGLLLSNPWTETDHLETTTALAWMLSPWALLAGGGLALLVVFLERRNPAGPDFALGLLVGEIAVLITVALHGLALLLGGEKDWHTLVFLTVLIHLPLAVIEGIVLGFTVRFLARVQPDLLGLPSPRATVPAVVLLAILLMPTPSLAHGLEAEASIDVDSRTITVTCQFSTGDVPLKATLRVQRADGTELTTVPLQDGKAEFRYDRIEPLHLTIDAGAGHRTSMIIPAEKLRAESEPAVSTHTQPGAVALRDTVAGVALVLALAAFLMSWRNSRRLDALVRASESREPAR